MFNLAEKGARVYEGILDRQSLDRLSSSKKNHNKHGSHHSLRARSVYELNCKNLSSINNQDYVRALGARTYLKEENNTMNNDLNQITPKLANAITPSSFETAPEGAPSGSIQYFNTLQGNDGEDALNTATSGKKANERVLLAASSVQHCATIAPGPIKIRPRTGHRPRILKRHNHLFESRPLLDEMALLPESHQRGDIDLENYVSQLKSNSNSVFSPPHQQGVGPQAVRRRTAKHRRRSVKSNHKYEAPHTGRGLVLPGMPTGWPAPLETISFPSVEQERMAATTVRRNS